MRLPTDDERKFAGCGKENRKWAWGDDYGDGTRSNGNDAKIGSTCAVGMFPSGVTPDFELHDMTGNAHEWALRPDDHEGANHGGIWGRSWTSVADVAGPGSLSRVRIVGGSSSNRDNSLGFRVVARASR